MAVGNSSQSRAAHASRATGLPEGTVTFVFTDIEESTRRSIELGDAAWARLLAEHHRLLREAFAAGMEVSTEGDGFFVAFTRAPQALSATVAAQRRLQAHAWPEGRQLRVRMGLHTGVALVRDNDYVGVEVNRASRVRDAAHGGQVLLSEATAGLVRDGLPEEVVLVDLGLHRLKDLGAPQRLFAIEAPGLPAGFPPPRSLDVYRHNLPIQRSSFVGRQAELARVERLLEAHALVTLTGVGGAGKTRLALQAAADLLHHHPDGVFFVDLAPLSDPDLVAHTTAQAVGLQLGGEARLAAELLVGTLSRRDCLLVLDNCEHLTEACAELADGILATCPKVRVLATSREPLGVDGEQVHVVPSLSVSDVGAPSEAVELFTERACAARSDFSPTPQDLEAIVEICRRLDGMPLAIELAAARISHLSAQQIAQRLNDRFRLLTGGRRRVRRQQTLEATLDWSHDLLDEPGRALLRRLAVFAGTFTLARVEEICTDEHADQAAVLDLLGSLVDKSLVTIETVDGELRYRLLETVRSYAETKLSEAGEAESYRSRHRDAYLTWLESTSWEDLRYDTDVIRTLVREQPNLRAALEWSQSQGRRDLVGRIAARMNVLWFWESRGAEGRRWLEWALDDPEGLTRAERAACHTVLTVAIGNDVIRGREFEEHAAQAVELGRDTLGGLLVEALGQQAMGLSIRAELTGDPDLAQKARSLAGEVLETGRQHGPLWSLAAHVHYGNAMLTLGEIAAAERALATVLQPDAEVAITMHWMAAHWTACCRTILGDAQGALEMARLAGDTIPAGTGRLWSHDSLAMSALAETRLGRTLDAATHLDAALKAFAEVAGLRSPEFNMILIYAGAIAHEAQRPHMASRLLAAARHVGAAHQGIPFRTPSAYALYRHYLPLVRAALDPDDARRCRDEGRALTPEDALDGTIQLVDALRASQQEG